MLKNNSALITGGAGFIGSNLAKYLLSRGWRVRILDNLSRRGSEKNLEWLTGDNQEGLEISQGDIRDQFVVEEAVKGIGVVFHLAAQVAVTTSVYDPRTDFEINAAGTVNVLEALRRTNSEAVLLYTSTNKVYGGIEEAIIVKEDTRYTYQDLPFGVSEEQPLDFHSPYGCSKGAADQYVRDYARIYGLRTVVFRMSCIYGNRQLGNEDQGWVAHFMISAIAGRNISIYGDGKQVRDLLYVEDLIKAFQSAIDCIDVSCGQVYNIGGGPENTVSVWAEFGEIIAEYLGRSIAVEYSGWRPGDQLVYMSDIRKAKQQLGWAPRISVRQGTSRLWGWLNHHKDLFAI